MDRILENYGEEILRAAISVGSIWPEEKNFVRFVTGILAPIYNDNRIFCSFPQNRMLVAKAFEHIIKQKNLYFDFLSAIESGSISPATELSSLTGIRVIYVRKQPKKHGPRKSEPYSWIEGAKEGELKNKRVLLIEDVISTGFSSGNAVIRLRNCDSICNYCFCIFSYGLKESEKTFSSMDPKCNVWFLSNPEIYFRIAKDMKAITKRNEGMIRLWIDDYETWKNKYVK